MISITDNADLTGRNTMRMKVRARRLIEFTDSDDLDLIRAMVADDDRILVMGAGSNLLLKGDFDGTVIVPAIDFMEFSGNVVTVGAGVTMDDLIAETCRRGLWGLENLSGIPGKVGASAVQNVGAYGVEAGDVIKHVWAYDIIQGGMKVYSAEECGFGYRDSAFKLKPWEVITSVSYHLSAEPNPRLDYGNLRQRFEGKTDITPADVRQAVIEIRNTKLPDPDVTGSAGSFFKNPVITIEEFERLKAKMKCDDIPHYVQPDGIKVPAAWLIERAGFKGFEMGNAAVWHLQPLVIVNKTGNATPDEIIALENRIVAEVNRMSGITLIPEVLHI